MPRSSVMEAVKTSEGTFFLPHKHGTQAGGRIKRKIYSSSALATIASMGGRKKEREKREGETRRRRNWDILSAHTEIVHHPIAFLFDLH